MGGPRPLPQHPPPTSHLTLTLASTRFLSPLDPRSRTLWKWQPDTTEPVQVCAVPAASPVLWRDRGVIFSWEIARVLWGGGGASLPPAPAASHTGVNSGMGAGTAFKGTDHLMLQLFWDRRWVAVVTVGEESETPGEASPPPPSSVLTVSMWHKHAQQTCPRRGTHNWQIGAPVSPPHESCLCVFS